ncbi:uncharacterized protein BDR25DRAFT_316431 [Lindgomyces ingoldianus]|uniref:Uncharacterized protein n=1 Tax=Lindgomyces ingoldianus TaxID=673940 RepID=A0ACB6QLH3_9PLEO|nr:uncharacterized protein BDR25DRAFT_316431 [Lindgomyces ingoldianus]KAF2467793.1 hypothetical protein BDR25DRAFT_316431 [Lindgomyces ingoldianus]
MLAPIIAIMLPHFAVAAVVSLGALEPMVTPLALLPRAISTFGWYSTGSSGGTILYKAATFSDASFLTTSGAYFRSCPSQGAVSCTMFTGCSSGYALYPSGSVTCGAFSKCGWDLLYTSLGASNPKSGIWCDASGQAGVVIYQVSPTSSHRDIHPKFNADADSVTHVNDTEKYNDFACIKHVYYRKGIVHSYKPHHVISGKELYSKYVSPKGFENQHSSTPWARSSTQALAVDFTSFSNSAAGTSSSASPSVTATPQTPKTGVIVGGTVGGIAIIGVAVVAVVFLFRRRSTQHSTQPDTPLSPLPEKLPSNNVAPFVSVEAANTHPSYYYQPGPTSPVPESPAPQYPSGSPAPQYPSSPSAPQYPSQPVYTRELPAGAPAPHYAAPPPGNMTELPTTRP